jgi:hypothetical protein
MTTFDSPESRSKCHVTATLCPRSVTTVSVWRVAVQTPQMPYNSHALPQKCHDCLCLKGSSTNPSNAMQQPRSAPEVSRLSLSEGWQYKPRKCHTTATLCPRSVTTVSVWRVAVQTPLLYLLIQYFLFTILPYIFSSRKFGMQYMMKEFCWWHKKHCYVCDTNCEFPARSQRSTQETECRNGCQSLDDKNRRAGYNTASFCC